MRGSTIVIILASLGYIVMGLLMLKNSKIEKLMKDTGMYIDTRKYLSETGTANIAVGGMGIILGVLDIYFANKSKYIVIIYIVLMVISIVIQKITTKKYKNF